MTTQTTTQKCERGYCKEPATALVHVDYPAEATAYNEPFRWTQPMCDEDQQVERVGARLSGATVTTEPLPVMA